MPSLWHTPSKKFVVAFAINVKGELHYMDYRKGLPQLVNLIISRSTFEPSDRNYTYLDLLIRDAVESFMVQPEVPTNPRSKKEVVDGPTPFMPDIMKELNSAYERLVTLGVDVKEIKEMLAKVVGPLKPRLVATFSIEHPAKEPFDSGLDQLMRLMRSRSTAAGAAAQGSKLGKEMHKRLDGRVREAAAGFRVKIELQPPGWMDPQYGLAVLVWAFEELQRWRIGCGELKDVLGKIVMAAREIEDQDAPLLKWTDEKPW
ncbi:MAG: hypothetical protein LQ339_001151 [Xanthoria mediterranea]|nr:MAG: hypothetical protein LQ339_001151 [Xanthoria mediterranea]